MNPADRPMATQLRCQNSRRYPGWNVSLRGEVDADLSLRILCHQIEKLDVNVAGDDDRNEAVFECVAFEDVGE